MNSTLVELRNTLSFQVFKQESLPFSCLEGGVPQGALSEWSGPQGGGKTEAALSLLREHPRLRAAWLEKEFSVYPPAFASRGINLKRILFLQLQGGVSATQVALQILKTQLFPLVVLNQTHPKEIELRRLQLAAQKSKASVIFLNEKPRAFGVWPLAMQARVLRQAETGGIAFDLLRRKAG